jgi:uncharacterized membrane protein
MDAYTIFKFLHVLSAICWAGGGLALLFLGIIAERQNDKAATAQVMGVMGRLGNIWFMPTSILTVIFGVTMAFLANLWSELWIMLGLAGFLSTFLTGTFLLKPRGDRAVALAGEGRFDEAEAIGREILTAAKFDYTVMLVVIGLMVFKPSLGDVEVLGVMAAALVAGAIFFLMPVLRSRPAQTA